MSGLREDRAALAVSLEAALEEVLEGVGLTVHGTVPEALEPPCVVVQAADPFLTPGDTFGRLEWAASYDLFLCVDLLTNAQAIEDLEDLLEALLKALDALEIGVDAVGRPGPVHTAEWVAHAVTVTVSRYVTL